MNCQTEVRFASIFFLITGLGVFEGSKISFYIVLGGNPAIHSSYRPAPFLSRAPSHQCELQSMLEPGFRHQLTNPSSYKLLEFPVHFSSLLQFHSHFLPSHPLFSVPLLQLQSPQQNAPSREDLPFQADPGKREMLLPHPHPPRGDL